MYLLFNFNVIVIGIPRLGYIYLTLAFQISLSRGSINPTFRETLYCNNFESLKMSKRIRIPKIVQFS